MYFAAKTEYKDFLLLQHRLWEEKRAIKKIFQHASPTKDTLPHESRGEKKNCKRQGNLSALQSGQTICMATRKQVLLSQNWIIWWKLWSLQDRNRVCAPRWASVCQWVAPSWSCSQQNPQRYYWKVRENASHCHPSFQVSEFSGV